MNSRDNSNAFILVGGGLLLIALLLVGGGGFVYFFLLHSSPDYADHADTTAPAMIVETKDSAAMPVPLPGAGENDLPAAVTIWIRSSPDGGIRQLVVQTAESELLFADVPSLTQHLERLRKDLPAQASISLKPDSRVKYGEVVAVMDACEKSRFRRPALAAPVTPLEDKK